MSGSLGDQISVKVQQAASRLCERTRLSVAVLGPGLQNPESPGSRKRRQIREALECDGHEVFFPEDWINPPFSTGDLAIRRERTLLSDDSVGLVILLCTEASPGALGEIFGFVDESKIVEKTTLLFPSELFDPANSLVGNTVDYYRSKMLYTEEQFEICDLVSECRKFASDRIHDESDFNNPQSNWS